jgi:hypothetical protein
MQRKIPGEFRRAQIGRSWRQIVSEESPENGEKDLECEAALSGEQLEFETRSRSHFSASRCELAQARAALVGHARLLESSACLLTKQSDRPDQPDSFHLLLHFTSEP